MTSINRVSAVTLKITSMSSSVHFYRDVLGLRLLYGGEGATFSSFQVGDGFLNLELSGDVATKWGRIVLHCGDVDAMHQHLRAHGQSPPTPRDAPWGERYFHVRDPDGHEISLATPLWRESEG
jgi:catechol 2,3-dioxygenase-like lactoylglutathione lyase family enzyme